MQLFVLIMKGSVSCLEVTYLNMSLRTPICSYAFTDDKYQSNNHSMGNKSGSGIKGDGTL